jgi:transmembrane protein
MTAPTPAASPGGPPAVIARLLDNPLTLFVTRVLVTLPFLISGIAKSVDWQEALAEMQRSGLQPAWAFNLAVVITQLGGSALIIANRGLWLGAGALGVFTLLTNFIAHRFWELSGAERFAQLNTFCEHCTIAAAFILVAVVYLRNPRVSPGAPRTA